MITKRLFVVSLLTLTIVASAFLVSAPSGYAQAEQGWSVPVNLSISGAATNPVMVIDSRETIHAIWMDDVDAGYKYSSSPDGTTWSQPLSVKFPFGPKEPSPVLLPGPNRSIHVFWLDKDKRLFYGQATPGDLPYSQNWILVYRLADSVESYNVSMDAQRALHVAYIQSSVVDDKPAGVYYTQSPSGGGFWIESRLLYQSEYFRSATQNDLYLRVSASNTSNNQRVYVTWDNRAQKRVFMATSVDSGLTWRDARQIKGPEDTGGFDTPFNLTVSALGRDLLLIWQVGDPGSSKCTVYSQWSEDGGENWGDAVAVLGGRSECPLSTNIIDRNADYMSVSFVGQVSPFVVAWNGAQWSEPLTQTQLPSIINPLTFDAILLGCRFDLFHKGRLYVTGCDQGGGGDVWFLSRPLTPVEEWFSPSVIWEEPDVLSVRTKDPERISHFRSAHDNNGNIHAVWVQSPFQGKGATIEYTRWDGQTWSTPESVINSLSGPPTRLLITADPLDRLLLNWLDGYNGDLVFSWANLERANLASEWVDVIGLPTPSRLVDDADVVVDGSGRIVTAYVVPINEERGVYIVQSVDNGKNWTAPVRAFDAIAAGWERVEQPRLSLGGDGVLHLVFVRNTVRIGQSVGLYYSRSLDGGATWSEAQIISEGEIQWADIVSYGDSTVHLAWQEYDGLVFANVSQVSQDGGITWGRQNNVTGVNEVPTPVSIASNGNGLLHFIQIVGNPSLDASNQKGLILQDWKWDGSAWGLELTRDLLLKGEQIKYDLSADITSTGFLGVFIPLEYVSLEGILQSEILTFSRFLGDDAAAQFVPFSILPVPSVESNSVLAPEVGSTPTPDLSILYDDAVSTSPLQQNIAGLVLLGVGVAATLFLLVWRRPAKK